MLPLTKRVTQFLLALTLVLGFGRAVGESDEILELQGIVRLNTPRVPSAKQLEGITSFFKDCYGLTDVEDALVIGVSRPSSMVSNAFDYVSLTVGPERDKVTIEADPESGTVFFFHWMDEWDRENDKIGLTRTHKDALSEDGAWISIERALKHYGLDTNRANYKMRFSDFWTMKVRDDLLGASWEVRKEFTWSGLPCRRKMVIVTVSAFSGTIESVHYWPIVLPESSEHKVDRYEAAARAQVWLWQTAYFGFPYCFMPDAWMPEDAAERAVEVIAPFQPSMFLESEPQPIADSLKTFYAWEVPFHYTQHGCEDVSMVVRVRMDNGDVIGSAFMGIEEQGPLVERTVAARE